MTTDQPPVQDERFKAEMPQIPGVGPGGKRTSGLPAPVKVIGGLVAVILVVVVIGALVSRSRKNAAPPVDPLPQVEVAPPDLGNPPATPPANRGIANTQDMGKAWSSAQFDFRNPLTGERIPSLLLRLPSSSAAQSGGYWALSLKAPYGNCELELVSDLNKLKTDYGYRAAKHPMVANPCTQTVFDPLKMSNLPGNIWVRGAIVQGSDLRPPLGIEIKIEGKDIFAVRME